MANEQDDRKSEPTGVVVSPTRAASRTIRAQARCALGRLSLPADPSWQCPPIRLSACPTCGADPGVQCVGIERNDEVHIDRVWQCLTRIEHGTP